MSILDKTTKSQNYNHKYHNSNNMKGEKPYQNSKTKNKLPKGGEKSSKEDKSKLESNTKIKQKRKSEENKKAANNNEEEKVLSKGGSNRHDKAHPNKLQNSNGQNTHKNKEKEGEEGTVNGESAKPHKSAGFYRKRNDNGKAKLKQQTSAGENNKNTNTKLP